MKETFKRFGFIKTIELKGDISMNDFFSRLQEETKAGNPQGIFRNFSIFFSGSEKYIGELEQPRFHIYKRPKMFERRVSHARAIGYCTTASRQLKVEVEITTYHKGIPFLAYFLGFFYLSGISAVIFADFGDIKISAMVGLMMLLHAAFIIGISTYNFRRSIRLMEEDIREDFSRMLSQ